MSVFCEEGTAGTVIPPAISSAAEVETLNNLANVWFYYWSMFRLYLFFFLFCLTPVKTVTSLTVSSNALRYMNRLVPSLCFVFNVQKKQSFVSETERRGYRNRRKWLISLISGGTDGMFYWSGHLIKSAKCVVRMTNGRRPFTTERCGPEVMVVHRDHSPEVFDHV